MVTPDEVGVTRDAVVGTPDGVVGAPDGVLERTSGVARLVRSRPRRRGLAGFTLLEVLIATAILGVAVVTLLGLQARNLALVAEAEELTVAGALATDVLAAARLQGFLEEGTVSGDFVEDASDADGRSRIFGGSGSARYSWRREVMPTALPTLQQMRVEVYVTGQERVLAEFWAATPTTAPRTAP